MRIVTPPVALVDVAYARTSAPVFAGDGDDRVEALLAAAQAAIEPPNSWVGRAFGVQTIEARFDGFPLFEVHLPCPPLRSVTSVAYLDDAGAEQTMPTDGYEACGVGTVSGGVMVKSMRAWPRTACRRDAVRIRFQAGYEANDPQLLPVKQAIVLAATHLRSLSTRELSLSSRSSEGAGSRNWVVSDAAEKLVRNAVEGLLQPFRVYA